jgi:penicillin-binding protein 1A
MVHIMEGVIERGTATVLRDLNRPMFGKTGTTSGPTNVWFVGGTPDVVGGVYLGYDQPRSLGGYAQGGRIAAPIFKDFAQVAFKDMPKVPFVAPPGIRWSRIDRASGRIVFGTFPVQEDPKSAVIWEAFQPQTEPRRAFRRSQTFTPYGPAPQAAQPQDSRLTTAAGERKPPRVVRPRPAATQPRRPAPQEEPEPLQPIQTTSTLPRPSGV